MAKGYILDGMHWGEKYPEASDFKYEASRIGGPIIAGKITVGRGVTFGRNIDIRVRGEFAIGDYSHLGDDVRIRGNNVTIGKHLYHSRGLEIGGGGHTNPAANFSIGDRCTIHDNYINIAMPVIIGDDVGLSREVSIQTHGYWLSVLEGFPAKFLPVIIEDGVIVGYRTVILPGVQIQDRVVVGACSVVTKSLEEQASIYAGNPCRFIRKVEPLPEEKKPEVLNGIIANYLAIAHSHGYSPVIEIEYPNVKLHGCIFNVAKQEFEGAEDERTDHFRDFVRKYGLRFYSDRPFRTVIKTANSQ